MYSVEFVGTLSQVFERRDYTEVCGAGERRLCSEQSAQEDAMGSKSSKPGQVDDTLLLDPNAFGLNCRVTAVRLLVSPLESTPSALLANSKLSQALTHFAIEVVLDSQVGNDVIVSPTESTPPVLSVAISKLEQELIHFVINIALGDQVLNDFLDKAIAIEEREGLITAFILEREVDRVYFHQRAPHPGECLSYEYVPRRLYLRDVWDFYVSENEKNYCFFTRNCKHLAHKFFHEVAHPDLRYQWFGHWCSHKEKLWEKIRFETTRR